MWHLTFHLFDGGQDALLIAASSANGTLEERC